MGFAKIQLDFIDTSHTVQDFAYLGEEGWRAVERVFKLTVFKL